MLAGIRLARRIGLAVGAFLFVYYGAMFISYQTALNYAWMIASGAAILAFFLPAVEATSFGVKEDDK
jgi:hypothetical protein